MSLVGLRLRTSVTSTIYKKSLKLSNASRKAQTGIVLPSLDLEKSEYIIMFQKFDN